MSMIDITHFTKTPVDRLKNLNVGDRIELLTYKKDRMVTIVKEDDQTYLVKEKGFQVKEFSITDKSKLAKLLKQLQQIEFPRSKKFFLRIISSDN